MVEEPAITGDGDAMTKNSRIGAVIKGQISKFSGIISRDLPKPKQKLVREMIYGIQAAKDIKLSNITRSLNEPIPLIKTEDRLSRNLDDRDFTDEINHQICRLANRKVLDDMVIAIDPWGKTWDAIHYENLDRLRTQLHISSQNARYGYTTSIWASVS